MLASHGAGPRTTLILYDLHVVLSGTGTPDGYNTADGTYYATQNPAGTTIFTTAMSVDMTNGGTYSFSTGYGGYNHFSVNNGGLYYPYTVDVTQFVNGLSMPLTTAGTATFYFDTNSTATTSSLPMWAFYTNSQWQFFWATNVVITKAPPENDITVHGSYSMAFASDSTRFPTNSLTTNALDGTDLSFSVTNVGWYSMLFGCLPGHAKVNFTDVPASLSADTISTNIPIVYCPDYIIAAVQTGTNLVTKYLHGGAAYISMVNNLNQVLPLELGGGTVATNNYFAIDAAGNASVYVMGGQAVSVPWSSDQWIPFATNGLLDSASAPVDACSLTPIGLPAIFP